MTQSYQEQIAGLESWSHDELVLACRDLATAADQHLAAARNADVWIGLLKKRSDAVAMAEASGRRLRVALLGSAALAAVTPGYPMTEH